MPEVSGLDSVVSFKCDRILILGKFNIHMYCLSFLFFLPLILSIFLAKVVLDCFRVIQPITQPHHVREHILSGWMDGYSKYYVFYYVFLLFFMNHAFIRTLEGALGRGRICINVTAKAEHVLKGFHRDPSKTFNCLTI